MYFKDTDRSCNSLDVSYHFSAGHKLKGINPQQASTPPTGPYMSLCLAL